jgi:hypothetical protein
LFNPLPSEAGIEAWTIVLTIISGLAFIGGALFALSYGFFFNWRKNPSGRALFWFIVSLDSVLAVVFLARFLGPTYHFRYQLTAAVYSAVTVTVFRLVVTLWKNWQKNPEPLVLEQRSRYETPRAKFSKTKTKRTAVYDRRPPRTGKTQD